MKVKGVRPRKILASLMGPSESIVLQVPLQPLVKYIVRSPKFI